MLTPGLDRSSGGVDLPERADEGSEVRGGLRHVEVSWGRVLTGQPGPGGVSVGDHIFDLFSADLRCLAEDHRNADCACIGDLI